MYGEGRHGHVLVPVNDAWLNLVHVHFVAGGVGMLDVPSPDLNVSLVRLEDMLRHVTGSWRAINLKWFLSSHNPGREDYVRETEGVIGMQMGEKTDPEAYRIQPPDTFLASRRSLPNDPRAKSTRYGVPLTTMAVHGPERSGSGKGVPVPRRTIWVLGVALQG